jgi:hypothetical protein
VQLPDGTDVEVMVLPGDSVGDLKRRLSNVTGLSTHCLLFGEHSEEPADDRMTLAQLVRGGSNAYPPRSPNLPLEAEDSTDSTDPTDPADPTDSTDSTASVLSGQRFFVVASAGADPVARDDSGSTPLHSLLRKLQSEGVLNLLTTGARCIEHLYDEVSEVFELLVPVSDLEARDHSRSSSCSLIGDREPSSCTELAKQLVEKVGTSAASEVEGSEQRKAQWIELLGSHFHLDTSEYAHTDLVYVFTNGILMQVDPV